MAGIYVWGTGRATASILGRYLSVEQIEAFVDNDRNKVHYLGKRVIRPEALKNENYEVILVMSSYRSEISSQCEQLGIDMDKVAFLFQNCAVVDYNRNYDLIEKYIGTEYAELVKNRYRLIPAVQPHGDLFLSSDSLLGYSMTQNDFVRIKTFEMVVKEIRKRNVGGSVAEFGVFRGEFAQYINAAFPDKKLYLFDTFEGFDAEEATQEKNSKNCTEAFVDVFQNTNIDTVLEKMRHKDNVVIKQGYFPESLDGLEDEFAFVSIDVDFEQSTYNALEYFYPRLKKGGYIFIHDYNSSLLGVEKAVDNYERDSGVILNKVPIADECGTLVITK